MSFNMENQRRVFTGPGPENNAYGIFQDEIPWMGSTFMIYSEIQGLYSNNCRSNCGACGIGAQ